MYVIWIVICGVVFFFKQKTAYEMRISDWSSDVCSSDLPEVVANILASALAALAEHLAARTEPGGVIALSGILDGQQPELLQIYAQWFDAIAIAQQGDWLRISGRRF